MAPPVAERVAKWVGTRESGQPFPPLSLRRLSEGPPQREGLIAPPQPPPPPPPPRRPPRPPPARVRGPLLFPGRSLPGRRAGAGA